MIELLPNMPMPNTTPGSAVRTPGQADFGQWLTPSPVPPMPTGEPPAVPVTTLPVAGDLESSHAVPSSAPSITALTSAAAATDLPLEAPSGTDPSQRIAWALVGGGQGEAVQLIASPWRLAPGDRLSQELRATLSVFVAEGPAAPTASIAPMPAISSGDPATAIMVRAAASEPARHATGSGLQVPVQSPQSIAAASASEEIAAGRSAAQAQAAHWPLRLLRWLNDSEAGTTLWLRDFTTEPGAASALVDDLRRFAQTEGLPLRRIVLNGQTLWSVESSLRDST